MNGHTAVSVIHGVKFDGTNFKTAVLDEMEHFSAAQSALCENPLCAAPGTQQCSFRRETIGTSMLRGAARLQ